MQIYALCCPCFDEIVAIDPVIPIPIVLIYLDYIYSYTIYNLNILDYLVGSDSFWFRSISWDFISAYYAISSAIYEVTNLSMSLFNSRARLPLE